MMPACWIVPLLSWQRDPVPYPVGTENLPATLGDGHVATEVLEMQPRGG